MPLRVIVGLVWLGTMVWLVGPAGAEARRVPVCAKKPGKTLLVTRDARAFERGDVVYACLRRSRRAFALGSNQAPAGNDEVRNLRLRGRYVAYSVPRGLARVRAKELRRGRLVHDATAATRSRVGLTTVTDLELSRRGLIAWIAKTQPFDVPLNPNAQPTDYLPDYEVAKFDRTGQTVLALGHYIAPRSLALKHAAIAWTNAGRRYSTHIN